MWVDGSFAASTGTLGPVTVSTPDLSPPTISANNASTSWFPSRSITLYVSDSGGSGLNLRRYSWDTALIGSCLSGGTEFANNQQNISVPEGSHRLYLCARDYAGNVGSWDSGADQYRVDSSTPTVSNNYTHNNQWVNTNQTITLTATNTGDSGIQSVQYCWGASCTPNVAGTTVSVTANTNNILRYKAMNNAGTSSVIGSITVRIDKTAPTCGSTWDPAAGSVPWKSTSQDFVLSGSTDTGGSGIQVAGGSCPVSTNGGKCNVTIKDYAQNTVDCLSPAARIDGTGPTNPTSFSATENGTELNGKLVNTITPTLIFSWPAVGTTGGASDLESGIIDYQIQIEDITGIAVTVYPQGTVTGWVGGVTGFTLQSTSPGYPTFTSGHMYRYSIRAKNGAGSPATTYFPGGEFTIDTTPPPENPVCSTFTADDTSLQEGQSTTLRWTTLNAVSASIDQGIGDVTGSLPDGNISTGSLPVNTPFTLTLIGVAGTTKATCQVTVNVAPLAETSQGLCGSWGGTWNGDATSADVNNFGWCENVNVTSGFISTFLTHIPTATRVCRTFRMKEKPTSPPNRGTVDTDYTGTLQGCVINTGVNTLAVSNPFWVISNFDSTTRNRQTPVKAIDHTDATNRSVLSSCAALTGQRYLADGYSAGGNWGGGDYCPKFGQKLKATPTYTGIQDSDYFENCSYNADPTQDRDLQDTKVCACPSGTVPLGANYTAAGIQSEGRIQLSTLPLATGECYDQKIVKCLYLGDASSEASEYFLDSGTGSPRCQFPSSGAVYIWGGSEWITQGCPDGQRQISPGQCVTCSSEDEGSTSCCQNGYSWWHSGASGGTPAGCYKPAQYECSVVIKNNYTPPQSIATVNGMTYDYASGHLAAGSALFSSEKNAIPRCNITCDDAVNLGIVSSDKPANSSWVPGAHRIDLNVVSTPLPFFQTSGSTRGACDWECNPGYVQSGTSCSLDNVPEVPPGDTTAPPPGGTENPGDALEYPSAPIGNVGTQGYDALTQKSSSAWKSVNDYFLSPSKVLTGVDDVALRFRIKEVPGGAANWPDELDTQMLKWKISGTTLGVKRTLTAIPECFDGNENTNGSYLCSNHFYSGLSNPPDWILDTNNSDTTVTFRHLQGYDSWDRKTKTIEEFLSYNSNTDPDSNPPPPIEYPVLEVEMIRNIKDVLFPDRVLARSVDYQLFIKAGDKPSIPGGEDIIYAKASVGGLQSLMKTVVGGTNPIPAFNYVLFQSGG